MPSQEGLGERLEGRQERPDRLPRAREGSRLAGAEQFSQDPAQVVRGGSQLVPRGDFAHPAHRHPAAAAGLAEVGEGPFDHLAALA